MRTLILAAALPLAADTLYFNGKVVTLDPKLPVAEAFLVRDGRFVKVGAARDMRADERVDLRGRTVVPGLNDSHTHPVGAGLAEADGEVPVLGSIADVQAYLGRIAATAPPGRLLFVPKVYSTRMREKRYPTRQELDAVSGDFEAMTDNSYASVLNSRLLKRLGISRDTPQPPNGKIIKDERGEPTGLVLGYQQVLGPLRASRQFSDAERMKALRQMQAAYNRVGITSTSDRGQGPDGFRLYQQFRRSGGMTVRTSVTHLVNGTATPEEIVRQIENIPFTTGYGDEWLRVGPVKTVADGGILIGTAYLREPYGMNTQVYGYSDPDYRGVLNVPREKLTAMARTANRLGWQMTAHTTGGGAIDALLDAYEEANRDRPIRDHRFTVTHGNFPNADAIAKAKRLGVLFDCQPQWFHFDGPALAPVFGPERTRWFLPLRSMLDAGIVVAGGSDHMIKYDARKSINAYHPFYAMWMAVTRRMADGSVLNPAERITREEALRMWTINGAHLTFEEHDKGTIEAGKLADFAILDRDFLTVHEDQIREIEPVATFVGGREVYRAGR
jgi:predicted amidohydrolase YtcJ